MTAYRQPRRINAVSLSLLAILAAGAYLGFRAWPVLVLRTEVKDALEEALPRLYRANLLPEPESTIAATELRTGLVEKLGTLGVTDADQALTLTMGREVEEVALSVKLRATIDLPPLGRLPVTLAPRAHTSAARVKF